MTKEEAQVKILIALRNSIVLVSTLDREDLYKLAQEFDISAKDLLEFVYKNAKNR
jgi:hypothetical protein